MKMFEMLGLNPKNHLLKFLNQQQLKLQILNLLPWKSQNGQVHTLRKPEASGKENNILKKNPIRCGEWFLWTTISSRILINHLLRN
jgi:hypothetical protein